VTPSLIAAVVFWTCAVFCGSMALVRGGEKLAPFDRALIPTSLAILSAVLWYVIGTKGIPLE